MSERRREEAIEETQEEYSAVSRLQREEEGHNTNHRTKGNDLDKKNNKK